MQQQKINGAPAGAILGGTGMPIHAKLVVDNPQEPLGPIGTAPTPARTAAVSHEDLMAELARLKAENERLKANTGHTPEIYFKVSEKGAVSVYRLGQFPVTLYEEQWERLLNRAEDLRKFIVQARKDGKLATPEQKLARKLAAKAEREAEKTGR